MKRIPLLLIIAGLPSGVEAQKSITLPSPDKKIVFVFRLTNGSPVYNVLYKNKPLIENSPLGLSFDNGSFKNNLIAKKPVYREADEKYELVVGKTKIVNEHYREVLIPLVEPAGAKRQINFVVRAFNDGIAFRYEFPQQPGWTSMTLTDEATTFRVSGDPVVRALFLPNYLSSHEGLYSTLRWTEIVSDTLMDMPALFEYPENTYMAITEAALVNYAGMYLSKHNNILTGKLSPLPGQQEIKVKAALPHKTPWRVLMISDRIGSLIESNIITNLNEPCAIKDLSWIKPGKSTWSWWNGNVTPDTTFAPGNNFETNKYYIDFCARNNLEFHSVIEYGLHEWYVNDGSGFQPGPNVDVTKAVPGLNMKEICDYAAKNRVDIRVWVHWAALYPKIDSAFKIFEEWGIKGMMIDFMDRDDQEMVNIQNEMVQKAAKHHLHIQFHGAYKPTGIHRTYPNEFTREGTLNYEVNKWDNTVTPDHDLNIAFVRMLAGPTDYHLGGFRAVPPSKFKVRYTRPLMMGTRCHMLAMYVILESYLTLVSDYPEAYEGQPGFQFIKEVPASWHETKVLDGKPSEFLAIARRKDDDWYIGAISNSSARDVNLPMAFLGDGTYEAQIYSDAADTNEEPNHLQQLTKVVTKKDSISIHIAAGGGCAIHIRKK